MRTGRGGRSLSVVGRWGDSRRLCAAGAGLFVAGLLVAVPVPAGAAPMVQESSKPAKPVAEAADEAAARTAARRQNSRVEALDKRTESSRTFVNPDGSFGTEQSLRPVRTRRQDGSWAAVDTTLRRAADGSLTPGQIVGGLRLSGGGSGPLAELTDRSGGRKLALSWPGALPKPTLDGDTAVYPQVLAGVDLRVRVDAEGFSHVLVVKDRQAAANPALRRLSFPVQMAGAQVRTDDAGGLAAVDVGGKRVFHAPKPLMWDSSGPDGDDLKDRTAGPGQARAQAAMPVAVADGALNLAPDAGLLESAQTRFPVFIDPSWRVDNPAPNLAGWTHVDSRWADQDYSTHWDDSNATTMPVGPYHDKDQGYTAVSRSLVTFSTSWLAGKTVNLARLQTTMVSSYDCDGATRQTDAFLSTWPGGRAVWNQQPAWYPDLFWSVHVARPCGRSVGVDFDVSSMVRSNVSWGTSLTSFLLKAPDSAENSLAQTFRRKFANNPTLYVEWNTPPNAPTGQSTENRPCGTTGSDGKISDWYYVTTRRPTFRTTVSDPDGGMLDTTYGVLLQEPSQNNTWVTVSTAGGHQSDVGSGGVSQWTVPVDLNDGWYAWFATTSDGLSASARSGYCYFYVDATLPPAPKAVTSIDYPNDGVLHGASGKVGTFAITPPDSGKDDIYSYVVTVNDNQPSKGRTFVAAADKSAVVQVAPGQADKNILYVWARDKAGNLSDATKPLTYEFRAGVGSGDIAHWTMNETAGTTVTDRLGGRVATMSGGVSHDQGVLHFDGSTGSVATSGPVVTTSRSFTVSAWLRLADDTRTQTILGEGGSQADAFQMRFVRDGDNRQLELRTNSNATSASSGAYCRTTAPAVGEWANVVLSYDAGLTTLRASKNGSEYCYGQVSAPFDAAGPLHLGYGPLGGAKGEYFAGDVDDVRVWDRAVYRDELNAITDTGDGPALRWDLDDNATTVTDSSGAGHPGTLGGSASWTYGNAVATDSSDRAVHIGDDGSVDAAGPVVRTDRSFTVAAWVRLDNANKQVQTVVSQDGSNTGIFRLGYSNLDRWVFAVYGKDVDGDSTAWAGIDARPAVGVWTHLAGVYDAAAGQIRLYINGVPSGSTSVSPLWNATGPLHAGRMIGTQGDGIAPYRFIGDIDDVRVYSGALADAEVSALL